MLVCLFAVGSLSFRLIDHWAFRQLVYLLNPTAIIPSRNTLTALMREVQFCANYFGKSFTNCLDCLGKKSGRVIPRETI